MEDEFSLDNVEVTFQEETPIQINKGKRKVSKSVVEADDEVLISPLTNEIITVRRIPKEGGMITNPSHVLYGGLAENATRQFSVPVHEKGGAFKNVLTNSEKAYLENLLGLDLSVYKQVDNFWANRFVELGKTDTQFKLFDPMLFIEYKILLANRDKIASSMSEYKKQPKATYEYVIVRKSEEAKINTEDMSATMQAYLELGAIKSDFKILKYILEIMDARPVSPKTDIAFLQGQIHKKIKASPELFVSLVQDPLLKSKILILDSLNTGAVIRRSDQYFLPNNTPLCEANQEATLEMAATYINKPKNQQLKLSLEAKLNE